MELDEPLLVQESLNRLFNSDFSKYHAALKEVLLLMFILLSVYYSRR